MGKRDPLVYLIIVFGAGCSLDYSQVSLAEEMSAQIPDSVLEEFSYTIVRSGSPRYRLEASRAEFFGDREETYLHGLRFLEFDSDGELVTEGNAERATYFTGSENAELEGSLSFYSASEEATVSSDYLYWDAENKLLLGRSEGLVAIEKSSGSRLSGVGFEADVRRRFVDFTGGVRGNYVSETQ